MDLKTILKIWLPWFLIVIFAAGWIYKRQDEANDRYVSREVGRSILLLDKRTGDTWMKRPRDRSFKRVERE